MKKTYITPAMQTHQMTTTSACMVGSPVGILVDPNAPAGTGVDGLARRRHNEWDDEDDEDDDF